MKTIIAIIILCLLITGCGGKEHKPVNITIDKDGTFLIDGKPGNKVQLQKYITKKMDEQNQASKVLFVSEEDTAFSVIEPILLAAAEARAFSFFFQIKGSSEREECYSNYYPKSRPPQTEIDLKIRDNLFYIENKKKSDSEIKSLLNGQLNKKNIDLIFISCSGKTTFGTFYKFIDSCNQSEDVSTELQIITKLE